MAGRKVATVSLAASAVLSAAGDQLERFAFPGAAVVGQLMANVVSLGVIALFFALILATVSIATTGGK